MFVQIEDLRFCSHTWYQQVLLRGRLFSRMLNLGTNLLAIQMRKGPIFKTREMLRRKTKSPAEIRYVFRASNNPHVEICSVFIPSRTPPSPT